MQSTKKLCLIEGPQALESSENLHVYWSQVDVPAGAVSLAREVETRASALKTQYLQWVYEFGLKKVGSQSLRSYLQMPSLGFSAWWLGAIGDKAPYNDRRIYEVLKLWCLELLYREHGCNELYFYGGREDLSETLRQFTLAQGHAYRNFGVLQKVSFQKWHVLRAIKYFFKFSRERFWPVLKKKLSVKITMPVQFQHKPQMTIMSYFPNFDRQAAVQGWFCSRYWGKLHELFEKAPGQIQWLWLYSPSEECSYAEALELERKFNESYKGTQVFTLLEEGISAQVLWQTLKEYFRLYLKGLRVYDQAPQWFCASGSHINFYSILKNHWHSSCFGVVAFDGIMRAVLFQKFVQKLPPQKQLLYLGENCPWERSLVSAWRQNQKTPVYAYQHSSVSYMDFRMFSHPGSFEGDASCPMPDVWVCNGSLSYELLSRCGLNPQKIQRAEAVRYEEYGGPQLINGPASTLLVVTDYLESYTRTQLRILVEAARKAKLPYEKILIKPHPFCPIEGILQELNPTFSYELTAKPLTQLWGEAGVVFFSNTTSACLEAIELARPIILCGAGDDINLNPCFGVMDVPFVNTADELLQAMKAPRAIPFQGKIFFRDENLSLWRKLLGYT